MESGQQSEFDQGVWRLELVSCPECGAESPKMKRCLSCGHIFPFEEETNPGEGVEIDVLPEAKIETEAVPMIEERLTALEPVASYVAKNEDECDPVTKDVMEGLVKSLSMQLWSMDMF